METSRLIRRPVAAGIFYPSEQKALETRIRSLLEAVGDDPRVRELIDKAGDGQERLAMLLVPHAAYEFAGSHLAAAFTILSAFLKNRAESPEGRRGILPERVFLAATVHRDQAEKIYLPKVDFFQSPLGELPCDREMIEALAAAHPSIQVDDLPFKEEYSLELTLPFLSVFFPGIPLVPILMGSNSLPLSEILGRALEKADISGHGFSIFIVSSNLSEYTDGEKARDQADHLIELLEHYSTENFSRARRDGSIGACGAGPLQTMLDLLGPDPTNVLILSGNSGPIPPEQREVRYGSFFCTGDTYDPGYDQGILSKEE